MTLKDEIIKLTEQGRITNSQKKLEEERKKDRKRIRDGDRDEAKAKKMTNKIIKDMPKCMKLAAQRGETEVQQIFPNQDGVGRWVFCFLSKWAKEQGFETDIEFNQKLKYKNGSYDIFTISWKK